MEIQGQSYQSLKGQGSFTPQKVPREESGGERAGLTADQQPHGREEGGGQRAKKPTMLKNQGIKGKNNQKRGIKKKNEKVHSSE